jgi:hypothetical protein
MAMDRHRLMEHSGGIVFFLFMLIIALWSVVSIIWYTIKGTVIEVGNANPNIFGGIFAGVAACCLINILIVAIDFKWRLNQENLEYALDYSDGKAWTAESLVGCPQRSNHHLYSFYTVHWTCMILFTVASAVLFVRSRAYNGAQDNEEGITELQQDTRYIQSMIGWTAGLIGAVFYIGSIPTYIGNYNDYRLGGRMERHDAELFIQSHPAKPPRESRRLVRGTA